MWQVLFAVVLFLALVVSILYATKWVYELGHPGWPTAVLLSGIVLGVAIEKFFPVVHGPARG